MLSVKARTSSVLILTHVLSTCLNQWLGVDRLLSTSSSLHINIQTAGPLCLKTTSQPEVKKAFRLRGERSESPVARDSTSWIFMHGPERCSCRELV